jgi:aryl-alcohol dehydrogenase-like predicted oxidoreductase
VPVPETTKLHHAEEHLGAAEVGGTRDDLREIDAAALRMPVLGHRYSDSSQRMVGP